ncbi:MAG: translation initiation factor IF-2 [Alphaproteobacteria bacterium]|nr:translation initiation factor IF-2 [Alphaproteobacteria bacterium]
MADNSDEKRPLTLGGRTAGKLELRKPIETGSVRQSFPHGRSKTVQVEVRRKRATPATGGFAEKAEATPAVFKEAAKSAAPASPATPTRRGVVLPHGLTPEEAARRARALKGAIKAEEQAVAEAHAAAERERELAKTRVEPQPRPVEAPKVEARTEDERRAEQRKADKAAEDSRIAVAARAGAAAAAKVAALTAAGKVKIVEEDEDDRARRPGAGPKRPAIAPRRDQPRQRHAKLTVTRALSEEDEKTRSVSQFRRQREREKQRLQQAQQNDAQVKQAREVVIPETITVQDLASRMAEQGGKVVKKLFDMGVMATINQTVDADTAELIATEFGHKVRRVSEADVEVGLAGEPDTLESLRPRPPVVTVMGHVDHGKTSLLDALRETDVVSGEAGGITQHIGAYQVTLKGGQRITFIDTPGHQAFTAMRARGAQITDIVVLVVAADDGIKEQTVEAIRHAREAKVPMIVAINKIDKPDAKPERVRQDLLQHEIVLEHLGGDVLDVEVSATKKINLDKLEEAILLQAEVLDLKANPDRPAEGTVIEAKLERGRGSVATVLIKRGTLKTGDIFVAGSEWGRVRALNDDHGQTVPSAGPAMPVEVLGLNGTPLAGDDFVVAESEAKARDIAEYRQRLRRQKATAAAGRGTLEQMFSQIAAGTAKEFAVVVKSDVQGSLEAINASLKGLGTQEVAVRVLHAAVGGINESDVILAKASNAVIIGFNVRANPQARDLARRDGVEIRYYSIIYEVIEEMKAALSGLLAPTRRERFLGNAEIREVFNISKVGKVAGCMVTEGMVRRGAKVRLLRDNVVIHEGSLKTLKRFKDEVREVREGTECGMAFENYENIEKGDVIECFEVEEVARAL